MFDRTLTSTGAKKRHDAMWTFSTHGVGETMRVSGQRTRKSEQAVKKRYILRGNQTA